MVQRERQRQRHTHDTHTHTHTHAGVENDVRVQGPTHVHTQRFPRAVDEAVAHATDEARMAVRLTLKGEDDETHPHTHTPTHAPTHALLLPPAMVESVLQHKVCGISVASFFVSFSYLCVYVCVLTSTSSLERVPSVPEAPPALRRGCGRPLGACGAPQ